MKVLRFLLCSDANLLAQNIVNYLLDAGHFVDIMPENSTDFWKINHNLRLLNLQEINEHFNGQSEGQTQSDYHNHNYDYVLYFNWTKKRYSDIPENFLKNLSEIKFYLEKSNDQFFIQVQLVQQCSSSTATANTIESNLAQAIFPLDLNQQSLDLKKLYHEMTEVFIDAVVVLLRFGNPNESEKTSAQSVNQLDYLMDYEKKLNQLENYYNKLEQPEQQDSLFLLDNLLLPKNENAYFNQFVLNNIVLDAEKLQILVASVLMAMNARQSGIYGYNFYYTDVTEEPNDALNQDLSIKNISKFLAINQSDTYAILQNQLNNTIYKIKDNIFYAESRHSLTQTKVGIFIDLDFQKNHALSFQYDTKSRCLSIRYDTRLYFCQELAGYIQHFIATEHLFFVSFLDKNSLTFYDLLCTIDKKRSRLAITENAHYPNNLVDSAVDYPGEKTIHQCFEEQVERTPDNMAVIFNQDSDNSKIQLTYRELNARANQLAHYLRGTYDIQPDDLVALSLERSEMMLIAILGVLKSGAAYVPMAVDYPEERISYILEDTKAKVVLVNGNGNGKSPLAALLQRGKQFSGNLQSGEQFRGNVQESVNLPAFINIQEIESICKKYSTENPHVPNLRSNNLAYVIYTSGTTGKPKGVMLEHRGIINRIYWMNAYCPLTEKDKILHKTPYVFDVSVWELFWANWFGACIVIAKPDEHKSAQALQDLIEQEEISILHFVPSMLSVFEESLALQKNDEIKCPHLKHIFCSGEALTLPQVQKCHELLPHVNIHNLYGPTEASIDVLYADCSDKNIERVTIGKPIFNTQAYVLDAHQNSLPMGVIGELYIGGDGLARGYLNRPELTDERLIVNSSAQRIYKTGDLVRMLPDGNIEYIGRNDFQIKISGFRIELGEVENVLLKSHCAIQHTVVTCIEDTINYLLGYYVSSEPLSEDILLTHLSMHLPEYMIPRKLIWLSELPLTINGKLDRKALPIPELISHENYIPPRNEQEKRICQIFAETLKLPLEKVGIRDDFFQLGGDSISAIKLVNILSRELSLKLSIADIFQYKTLESILDEKVNQPLDATHISPLHTFMEWEQRLSFAQERLWFIEQYEKGSDSYNAPFVLRLKPAIDLSQLKEAINKLVNRHEILRTFIKTSLEGYGYQSVMHLSDKPLDIFELTVTAEERQKVIQREAHHIFKLDKEYPIRVIILNEMDTQKEIENRYLFFIIHHIAFDGWSLDVFLKDLQACYEFYDKSAELTPLTIQYKDFAVWQRNYFTEDRLQVQMSYWKNILSDYTALQLPTDYPRPPRLDYAGEDFPFVVEERVSQQLRNVAKNLKVSLYSVLLSAYYLLLRSFSHQDDIILGTPMANRHHSQLEPLVGFFVNTLALRSQIDSGMLITDYIQVVGQNVMEAQWHQDLPFEKLITELNVEPDTSRHPLFQVLFCVQPFGFQGLTLFEPYSESIDYTVAKFDLTTMIDDSQTQLKGLFNYATSLFNISTIQNFVRTYLFILEQIGSMHDSNSENSIASSLKIQDLRYLNFEDYQRIVYDWNAVTQGFSSDKTIHQVFEEQVEKTPDNMAIVFDDLQLTYNELNAKANQLAHYLRNIYAIQADDLIALCISKSEYLVIAILGVLKAGAAYVPIDPNYPEERINYILEDTRAKVVLVNENGNGKSPLAPLLQRGEQFCGNLQREEQFCGNLQKYINIQEIEFDCKKYATENPHVQNLGSNNLAYIIYTSGTTGKPKGVMQTHENVTRMFSATDSWFSLGHPQEDFDPFHTWVLFHSYVFDFTVWEMWGALCYGSKLIIPNQEQTSDFELFYALCKNHGVTILNQTPTEFYQWMDIAIHHPPLPSLKAIVLGGETLNIAELKPWFDYVGDECPQIINLYGITETMVYVTHKNIQATDPEINDIGTRLLDQKTYVLNDSLQPLPVGAIGELYIGGAGLARGYLNQAELTRERFIVNPFQTNERLYKTGDRVRYLSNGHIEFFGRTDLQVKIRGFRIELGEIENSLLKSHSEIHHAAITYINNQYLVGYYVAEKKLDETLLFHYLMAHLPDHMMPVALVWLAQLPLTINGKLDQKALPIPQLTSLHNYVPPRNKQEEQVREIFAEVLELSEEQVGICDDFFRLGGNSILAIKLVNQLSTRLSLKLPIMSLFQYRTIEGMLQDGLENNENESNNNKKNQDQNELDALFIPRLEIAPEIDEWLD